MIFVTVGMHTQSFERLVRAADEMAAFADEPVIIQRGAGAYMPQVAQHVDYVDEPQIEKWLSEARVIVSHAGAGTILGALRLGKPLVLAPRMARFGEHFDDHQFELAGALAEKGRAVVVTDLSAGKLAEAIELAQQLEGSKLGATGLHTALRNWLAEEEMARRPSRLGALFHWDRKGG